MDHDRRSRDRLSGRGAERRLGLESDERHMRLMPADPAGDALHLALASFHKCEFLVTWNCLHLANANKFGHLRRVNGLLGLYVPVLATPLELLGESDESPI
jgi:hypothetical protein